MHRFEDRTKQRRLTLTNARSHHAPAKTQSVRVTSALGFPLNGFTHCLTLFSKFFSSFPHGTCSLSVSYQYLALDEVYHPLNAALSSCATQRKNIIKGRIGNQGRGSHPPWQFVPKHLGHRLPRHSICRVQSGSKEQVSTLSSSLFTRRY